MSEVYQTMPSFFDKLKGGVSDVFAKLANQDAELKNAIDENKDFLDASSKLAKESTEAIDALKAFATNETPAVKEAYIAVSEVLATIEKSRTELVAKLETQFLGPLMKLADEYKKVSKATKEDESSAKDLKNAMQDLEKLKKKPAEKVKPGEVTQAEMKVTAAQNKASTDHESLAKITEEYAKLKVATLKEVIQTLVILEGEFYQIASSMLDGTKATIAAINVEKELDSQVQ
ncbi:MAG: hypothetical protein JW839_02825 [Candidatus Lokiarchaeota archaeon]|nr:hypothetical protein [Candidatus Lokiarchaeota archaeon]